MWTSDLSEQNTSLNNKRFMWFKLIRRVFVSRIFSNKFYLLDHLIITFRLEFLYYWIEVIVGIILI